MDTSTLIAGFCIGLFLGALVSHVKKADVFVIAVLLLFAVLSYVFIISGL